MLTQEQREATAYMRGAQMAYNDAAQYMENLLQGAPETLEKIMDTAYTPVIKGLREKARLVNEMTMTALSTGGHS